MYSASFFLRNVLDLEFINVLTGWFVLQDGQVAAYVEDLRSTLNEGSIMHRKAFLNSFIRRINIKDSEAEIEYTCPIGLPGNHRNEVLSMGRIGSPGNG